jgi:hypothetical protein
MAGAASGRPEAWRSQERNDRSSTGLIWLLERQRFIQGDRPFNLKTAVENQVSAGSS